MVLPEGVSSCLLFVWLGLFFRDRVFYSPGWPPTYSIVKDNLEFVIFLPLRLCTRIAGFQNHTQLSVYVLFLGRSCSIFLPQHPQWWEEPMHHYSQIHWIIFIFWYTLSSQYTYQLLVIMKRKSKCSLKKTFLYIRNWDRLSGYWGSCNHKLFLLV